MERDQLCRALKPNITPLREAFAAPEVRISYDNREVIATYLLLYYPNYAAAAHDAMSRFRPLLPTDRLNVAFFCGGALPELLGVALCMRGEKSHVKALDAVVFDKHSKSWAWARNISKALTRKFAPDVTVRLESRELDLLGSLGEEPIAYASGADLVVYQHCLNEFASNAHALDQIEAIGRAARMGSLFLFLDQELYGVTTRALRGIRSRFIAMGYDVIEDCETPYDFVPPDFFLPDPLKYGFFDGPASKDEKGNWTPGHRRARSLNLRALTLRKVR